jgi:hypothetical protein
MRLPSFSQVLQRAGETFTRFPLTLLNCVLGVACIIIELESRYRYGQTFSTYDRLAITCLLGLPIFLAIELFLERRGEKLELLAMASKRPSLRLALYLATLVGLGVFYTTVENYTGQAIRTFLLAFAAHLVVSFIAYLKRDETNGFWQINKLLFIRILVSILFTSVLMGGLSLALGAVDQLFKVNIPSRTYAELAAVLYGIFNTWFFLAGIPHSLGSQQERTDYPAGLKVFTQFVLLPLVTIYLVLLYAYAIKLLIDWELPNGWVSNPVLWFSVVGILSFLLLYPLRDDRGNEWIRSFARYFYIALLPLLVLPVLGIYRRVSDYGLTVERYLVIALVVWLFGISLYFILSRRKDIRLIPISLAIGALIAAIGPVSAFSLSKRDQFARLEEEIRKYALVTPTRNYRQPVNIPYEAHRRIHDLDRYLIDMHGYETTMEWLQEEFKMNLDSERVAHKNTIAIMLNIMPEESPMMVDTVSAPVRVSSDQLVAIRGYDLHARLEISPLLPDVYNNGDYAPERVQRSADGLLVINDPRESEISIVDGSDTLKVTYLEIAHELRRKNDSVSTYPDLAERIQPEIVRENNALRVLIWAGDVRLQDNFTSTTSYVAIGFHGDISLFIRRK